MWLREGEMLFSELPQSQSKHKTSRYFSLPHSLKSRIHASHFLTLEYPWEMFHYCFPLIKYSLFNESLSHSFLLPPLLHPSKFSLLLNPPLLNISTFWEAIFFVGMPHKTPFTPPFPSAAWQPLEKPAFGARWKLS